MSWKIGILYHTNKKTMFSAQMWSENCSFLCTQYLFNMLCRDGDQPVALCKCNESSACFDDYLQVICIVGSRVSHFPLVNTP